MASTEYDNNCTNCLHRAKETTAPGCVACIDSTDGSHFPGWEPKEPAEP